MKKTKRSPITQFGYGNIYIPLLNSPDPLVPRATLEPDLPLSIKKALALSLRDNLACLLVGEAGSGKTSAVRHLAYKRRQAYVRVNMTGFTTPDELIGSKSVKGGETYYEDGIITNAMRRGAILVIDEINATTPDCLFILHGLLDEDRRISLPNGDIVTPHAEFRIFATCNPDYEGTKSLNRAFIDRFPLVLQVDTLGVKGEIELLVKRMGVTAELATNLVTIATIARKDYFEQKTSLYVSTRSLLQVAHLTTLGFTPKEAYTVSIVQKTQNKDEQKAILDFFLAVMRDGETEDLSKPVILTKAEYNQIRSKAESYQNDMAQTAQELTETKLLATVMETELTEYKSKKADLEKDLREIQDEDRKKAEVIRELKAQIEGFKRLEEFLNKKLKP